MQQVSGSSGPAAAAEDGDPIYFYDRDKEFYEFTNFAPFAITLEGKKWPTTEHYFQAQKFAPNNPQLIKHIRNMPTPRDAFQTARDYAHDVRPVGYASRTGRVVLNFCAWK